MAFFNGREPSPETAVDFEQSHSRDVSPESPTAVTAPPIGPEPTAISPEPAHHPAAKKRSFFLRRRRPESSSTSSSASSVLSGNDYHSMAAGSAPSTTAPLSASGSVNRRRTLHRTFGNGHADEIDPSIAQARDRVMSAEAAERDADLALDQARSRVREARQHVKRIEEEAKEEARRAMIKHQQAREIMRRGKDLGREYHETHKV